MQRLMTPDEVVADPELWHAWRSEGITASEIAGICGIAPKRHKAGSPMAVYLNKLMGEDLTDERRLRRGRVLEPIIIDDFRERFPGMFVGPGGLYAHDERSWQMATFDGLLYDGENPDVLELAKRDPLAVLEGKTWATFDGFGPDGSDEVPIHIKAQHLWQLSVADLDVGFIAVEFLPGWQFRVYEFALTHDMQADIDFMLEEAEKMRQMIAAQTPPPIDDSPATREALQRVFGDVNLDAHVTVSGGLWRRLETWKRHRDEAQAKLDLYKNELRARMGNAGTAVLPSGRIVATRNIYTRRAFEVAESQQDRLTIKSSESKAKYLTVRDAVRKGQQS